MCVLASRRLNPKPTVDFLNSLPRVAGGRLFNAGTRPGVFSRLFFPVGTATLAVNQTRPFGGEAAPSPSGVEPRSRRSISSLISSMRVSQALRQSAPSLPNLRISRGSIWPVLNLFRIWRASPICALTIIRSNFPRSLSRWIFFDSMTSPFSPPLTATAPFCCSDVTPQYQLETGRFENRQGEGRCRIPGGAGNQCESTTCARCPIGQPYCWRCGTHPLRIARDGAKTVLVASDQESAGGNPET
jgi:hypothetical protein